MVGLWHNEAVTMRTKRHAWSGESSPHPFIPRIPLAFTLLLPLLIALLVFLLLGTAPSAVVEFFLIHLTLVIYGALVWGGLVSLWPLVGCRRRMDIRRRVYGWRDG
jgi:hypothetical protein